MIKYLLCAILLFLANIVFAMTAAPRDALAEGRMGLYSADQFRVTTGRCSDCAAPPQALWYFEDEIVAVPRADVLAESFSPNLSFKADVAQWQRESKNAVPFMVWLASPLVVENSRLVAGGKSLKLADQSELKFAVVPKISSNLSYYNDASQQFFAQRSLRLRGSMQANKDAAAQFIARVIWPEDFRVDAAKLLLQPLQATESLAQRIKDENGGAQTPFAARLLWERGGSRDWRDKAVLGLMLNGAQGDDDEAHGGHFAVVTGINRADGQIADWMVNNFYNLANFSEKGITAAMLPMDNYLADLNSGQSYYRPSYLLFAILKTDRAARSYQGAISRVYAHFYRHDFPYDHAKANCTGISMDTLHTLGWHVPERGITSRTKAAAGYYYTAATDLSFSSARKTYKYLATELTKLYPRVAFEAGGEDWLRLVGDPTRAKTDYEKILRDDIEAIVFVRIPQIPSSRVWGSFPIASFDEFMARVPADRANWKIIPVPPALFDMDRKSTSYADELWAFVALVLPVGVGWFVWRRRPKKASRYQRT
jgi:hypothetical protein